MVCTQDGGDYQVITNFEGCNKVLGIINSTANQSINSDHGVRVFDIYDYKCYKNDISGKVFIMRIAANPRTEPTPELRETLENVLDQV